MRKVIAYVAQSLDGYIATPDGKVDWLETVEIEGDAGYAALYNSIDTVIMGRTTFEWISRNASEYPYSDKTSYVVTSSCITASPNIHIVHNIEETIRDLKSKEGKDIWVVGGGKLISSLINNNMVDELRLTIAPILLGNGIPLFTQITSSKLLHFKKSIQYGQFVELDYSLYTK